MYPSAVTHRQDSFIQQSNILQEIKRRKAPQSYQLTLKPETRTDRSP